MVINLKYFFEVPNYDGDVKARYNKIYEITKEEYKELKKIINILNLIIKYLIVQNHRTNWKEILKNQKRK